MPESSRGVTKTAGRTRKVRRVRKVAAKRPPEDEGDPEERSGPWTPLRRGDDEDGDGRYRFVTVPPIEGEGTGGQGAVLQQVRELHSDFVQNVAYSDDAFTQFMLWAAETEGVKFQDLLIATRSIYDLLGVRLPGDKETWRELREMANLVEVTTVSDSELEYALEVFSKTFDLYKAELRRLDDERSREEQLSSRRISDEILAEDEGLLQDQTVEEAEGALPGAAPAEGVLEAERWEKVVDDTRSKINSTKAEFDELVEELTPFKAERDSAVTRLRVLEKDENRKRARLEWFQRGRISDAKAEEIQVLERELTRIEEEREDWSSRLGIAQSRIDERLEMCEEKRREFKHIDREVNSLIDSLPSEDRSTVQDALAGELVDLEEILGEVDRWLGELSADTAAVPADPGAILASPPPPGVEDEWEGVAAASGSTSARPSRTLEDLDSDEEEPPVVFMDTEVREMLRELPIERPPDEELIIRIEKLQRELMAKENTILELESSIERLLEDREGTSTAVELERNKIRMELAKTQDELTEKQQLLEQYLDVIKALEDQMESKDRELKETLALNRRKTDELKQKEQALKDLERELLEKQEEYRAERQELQDRESRLNAQVKERETQEREIAKKDLTLELRSEQIHKKMDRLNNRELELQRLMSQQKEQEEMLSLKDQELQNLKAELDVREEELRRREGAVEDRSEEAKKLQKELSKLEHRVKTRDEAVRRREATASEEEKRVERLEKAMAEREVQLQAREENLALREAELDASLSSIEGQRDDADALRREASEDRQEVERLRIAQERRHEELLRREDQLNARESTLKERERAAQIREERLTLERGDIERLREQQDDMERKWSARERTLLEQLEGFNAEKQQLLEDWKAAKRRVRELEGEKSELTARMVAAEGSLMQKDGEIMAMARQVEALKGEAAKGMELELDDGTRATLNRVLEDMERQRGVLDDMDGRARQVEERERELVDMEEILSKERERLKELQAEQERGREELNEALSQLSDRTKETEELEREVTERRRELDRSQAELVERERSLADREAELDVAVTASAAEARAEDREEELVSLQRDLEERTRALEAREERLEADRASMDAERQELERQKADLAQARENLLSVREELVEVPPPEGAVGRAPEGLASRAARMAADDVAEPPPADSPPEEGKPIARLRCKVCGTVIPIYTEERPLQVTCPSCGKGGTLR